MKSKKIPPISKHSYPIFKAGLQRVIRWAIDTYKVLCPIIRATFGEKAIWVVILQSISKSATKIIEKQKLSLLSTKKRGTCIKNKNYRKLSQNLTKITLFTTKIAIYYSKLTKILNNFGSAIYQPY